MGRIRRDGEWEAAQTHASLLPYLLEESWELVDAVADGDRDEMVSELGDLLLQVLFHAAIGEGRAEGSFDIDDVAGALLDKLRRRAPYWFTAEGAAGLDATEQDRLWQEAKAAERADRPPRGVVDGIPWDMPALALGQKVLARARAAGVPGDLVPSRMRVVQVDAAGLFHEHTAGEHTAGEHDDGPDARAVSGSEPGSGSAVGSESGSDPGFGSAEVAYRQVVRSFARDLREAEARLDVPVADAAAEDWRAAWPARPA
ncbi:nucleoside triphosphate hydrolase [Dietzia sp. JS16-p6b]|nr:nucleoside triphosphate hydrolase [Dietzia sp. JS16-p6b]